MDPLARGRLAGRNARIRPGGRAGPGRAGPGRGGAGLRLPAGPRVPARPSRTPGTGGRPPCASSTPAPQPHPTSGALTPTGTTPPPRPRHNSGRINHQDPTGRENCGHPTADEIATAVLTGLATARIRWWKVLGGLIMTGSAGCGIPPQRLRRVMESCARSSGVALAVERGGAACFWRACLVAGVIIPGGSGACFLSFPLARWPCPSPDYPAYFAPLASPSVRFSRVAW
jgi:hypothetical protein